MAPSCCIVPKHVLQDIIDVGEAQKHVLDACRSTIDQTKELHNNRIEHKQSLLGDQERPAFEGIIPSYIFETIAREATKEEQRNLSLHMLAHETNQHVVTGALRHLNRTVHDARHTKGQDPPRSKIMIKEGGALVSEEQDPTYDANECYIGFQKTYNFYFNFFNRDSIDGRGISLDGFVHYGKGYLNAFWDGKEMIFGDGDGVLFNGFTNELDVFGHELTHGVVEYISPLDYSFQSGALNESLAGVFGIMIKQWGNDPVNPQTAEQSDWLIGEGIWAKGVNGRALHDMKAPGTAYNDRRVGSDCQPGHWKDFGKLSLSQDQGGVHINSGIPNHAFYLASTLIGGYTSRSGHP